MNNSLPEYLTPSILIGSVAAVAAILTGVRQALKLTGLADRVRERAFWTVSALLVGWFFAALALSWSGVYRGTYTSIPTIPFGLLIPIVFGVALYWRWPVLRQIVESVPQSWLIAIQIYRAEGLIFLLLYAVGRLPGEFAWPAGVGDVMVGLLAPLVAVAYRRGLRGSAGLVRAWNLLGLLDLLVAVTTGFLTSPSPLQLLAFDRPNELISAFPLAMIPVFLVPLSVLLHLASLEKLRQAERARWSATIPPVIRSKVTLPKPDRLIKAANSSAPGNLRTDSGK
jgi:hypothetical protein